MLIGTLLMVITPSYAAIGLAAPIIIISARILQGFSVGGEFGSAWHDGARGTKRQNAFDDFIAAAQWLIANKYTRPDRLGSNGASNGDGSREIDFGNTESHWWDGSQLYGADQETQNKVRTFEDGKVALVHPENWKRGRKYNSERRWISTVYHEMGHYVLWADAERKADAFAYGFVRGVSLNGRGRRHVIRRERTSMRSRLPRRRRRARSR